MRTRRSNPWIAFLVACLPGFLASAETPSGEECGDMAHLRSMEAAVVRAVEATKRAFVFFEGGSGFLISPDGLALTNEHVIGGRNEAVVQLKDGRSYHARVLGHDPEGDVALVKLDGAENLPCLELGDSGSLEVGQPVIALGDPFLIASMNLFLSRAPPDQEPSASLGIVSALHRYSDTYSDAIQVDVAVNRGNSGGPLLTLDGKVVGINGKIETRFAIGVNSGCGYAIPSNQVKNFLDALKGAAGGAVRHGTIVGIDVENRAAGGPGLPVRDVDEGSTAAKAGFKKGDVIVSIEGLVVPTRNRFKGVVSTFPVGRKVAIKVLRGSESKDLEVVLEPKQGAFLGIQMEQSAQNGGAILVEQVLSKSAAETAGLKQGDLIIAFQGQRVPAVALLKSLIERQVPGDEVNLAVLREGKILIVKVRLGANRARVG